MKTKSFLKIGLPVAVVVLGVAGYLLRGTLRGGSAAPPRYETAPVSRGRISATVTASGTLSPTVTVQVGSQISGRVQALYADFNSHVKKGQVIARIDPSVAESQVAQARANEAVAVAAARSAEAALAEAQREHARTTALVGREVLSKAEGETTLAKLQAAEADAASARAKIAQARAAREQAETNLGYTTIASPIDGVVISRDVDVGQTVAASLQAPTLFTLAEDLRKMEVHTSVAESDVGRVQTGMPVEFTVDAYPNDHFKGAVKEVRYSPKTVQNVVTYDAVVSVDNTALKLRPGMTADVSFTVEELTDTLLVPNAALRFRPPGASPGAAAAGASGTAPAGPGGPVASGGTGPTDAAQQRPGRPGAAPASGGDQVRRGPRGAAVGATPGSPPAQAPQAEPGGVPRGTRRVVWVVATDGQIRPVQIRIGPSDGKSTAVLGGELAEGDRVVTGMPGSAPAGPSGASGPSGRPRFGRFL